MGQDPSTRGAAVTAMQDPEQIKEQIDATRQELGDTIEALTARTDVKAQAKRKLEETRTSVAGKKDELLGKTREASPEAAISVATGASRKAKENPLPVAVTGAFALGFLSSRRPARPHTPPR